MVLTKEFADAFSSYLLRAFRPVGNRIKELENRVARLEADNEAKSYCGVYNPGEQYVQHNMVTMSGSLWIALTDTTSRPGTDRTWQLAVKRGRNARQED